MKTSILRPARRAGFVSLLTMAILSAGASATMADATTPVPEGPIPVVDAPDSPIASVKIPTATEPAGGGAGTDGLSIEIIPKPEPEPEPVVETLSTDVDNPVDGAPEMDPTSEDADLVEVAPTGDLSEGLLTTARSGIGVPYVWAGSTQSGWDCSGFTSWVYAQNGISLPHSSAAQAAMGTPVSQAEAQVGDLVHWPGHVGIYAGDGKVVDAGTSPQSTTERNIWGNPTFTHIESGS